MAKEYKVIFTIRVEADNEEEAYEEALNKGMDDLPWHSTYEVEEI